MDLTPIPGWESVDFAVRRRRGSTNRSGLEVADLILAAYHKRHSQDLLPVAVDPPQLALEESGLSPPDFPDTVTRQAITSQLTDLSPRHPVLSVEGLSGSGKTYSVGSFVNEARSNRQYSRVFWHDPRPNESLDELFAYLEVEFHLRGRSAQAKSKELLALLSQTNSVLVIDDFHHVDRNTYEILVDLATRYRPPCRVILLSRTYIALTHGNPEIAHVKVSGLSIGEATELLSRRGSITLSTSIIRDLIEKTEGLPLAVSLFGSLVSEFGRDPIELLSGEMVRNQRFRLWLDEVLDLVGPSSTDLLLLMSVCTGPFNMGVIRVLTSVVSCK